MNLGPLKLDLALFTPVAIIVILGLTTLFSINVDLFKSQLIFLGVSLIAFFLFSLINYKIIPQLDLPIYVVSLVLLLIVLLLGFESHGAVRWLDVLGVSIQISELLKPFLLLCLASFLMKRKPTFKTLVMVIALFLPVALLIFLQPNLGNTLIYFLVLVMTLFTYGFPMIWFIGGIIAAIAIIPIFWRFLHDYQRQRVLTFLYPTNDPLGTSYNAIQSIIAVGSGMFFGKGLSVGTQSSLRFLPERHTDFIFATMSESLGFVGSMVVIVCFILLLVRMYMIFRSCEDVFGKIFVAGGFFLFLIQFFINIGMNVGILPIVGITLPFMSYGGNSLVSSFIILGLTNAFANEYKRKDILEIR